MFLAALNIVLASILLPGQISSRPVDGTLSDLRGLRHVFIDSGADKARDRIIRERVESGNGSFLRLYRQPDGLPEER